MGKIGYGYGSEWHLLRYLGYHRAELSNAVRRTTGGAEIEWLDHAFSRTCKPLSDDTEWLGVRLVGASVNDAWKTYWPVTGTPPCWDAVGQQKVEYGTEWILVEAKAYAEEMRSKCGAGYIKSGQIIRKAFEETATIVTNKGLPTEAWYTEYDQYANRLAILNFLLNRCFPSVSTRLVLLCFCGDRTDKADKHTRPSNPNEWQQYLHEVHARLDISDKSPLMQRVHHVFLPVNPKCK